MLNFENGRTVSFIKTLTAKKLVRFGAVGVINTAVDVVLFTFLRFSGFTIFSANIISTSVALSISLLLNNRYTFQGQRLTIRRISLYVLVTLAGLWILQPVIINGLTNWNDHNHFIETITAPFGHPKLFVTLLPKLSSLIFTLAWNYLWYSKVIFAPSKKPVAK